MANLVIWLLSKVAKISIFCLVPNRKQEILYRVIEKHINKETTLITNDYSVHIDNKVLPKQSKITAAFRNISHR